MLNVLKSYTYIKNTVCVLVCLLYVNVASAQTDSLFKVQEYYNQKNYNKAKILIEKCLIHPETSVDPGAWQMRSFIYKEIYQTSIQKHLSTNSYLLDSIVSSSLRSISLDKENAYKENNLKLIEHASKLYYVIASKYIKDSTLRNFEIAQKAYNKHKSILLKVQPNYNFTTADINFYSVVGGLYADLYVNAEFDNKYGEIAKSALMLVLELDPKNIAANMNLGIVYYNQGATLMRKMDYDTEISQVYVIEENAAKLFKQSFPYINIAYEQAPTNEKALDGMIGIYKGLNDLEKFEEYKKKKELLKTKSN